MRNLLSNLETCFRK